MKPLYSCIAALVLVASALVPLAPADDAPPEKEQILGTWKVVSLEVDGNKAPDDVLPKLRVTFQAERVLVKGPDKDQELEYKLDLNSDPKSLDVTHLAGEHAGKTSRAIFKLEEGKLTVCAGEPGASRPTEFRSVAKVVLAVFERVDE